MTEILDACRRAAAEAGIPVELLVACGVAESNLSPTARRPRSKEQDASYWPDVSFGIAQQTVRWADEYAAWCRERGHPPAQYPGEEAIRTVGERYYDVEHAARVAARNLAQKWALYKPDLAKTLQAYNWPAGGGRPVDAAVEQNYRRGLTEAARLLSMGGPAPSSPPAPAPPATLVYSPDTPPERQVQDWACSIRTATWLLKSLGVPADAGDLQDEMVPRYVTPAAGLLDARGYGIAETVKAHLPEPWRERVRVFESIAWDEARSLAGRGPLAIGGRAWNHWSAVRRPNPDGTLALANPAPNWQGVGDTMDRAEWDRFGPWSAVWINAEGAPAQPVPPVPADDPLVLRARIAELTAQLADKSARLDAEVSRMGYVAGDVADAVQAIAETLRRLAPPAA